MNGLPAALRPHVPEDAAAVTVTARGGRGDITCHGAGVGPDSRFELGPVTATFSALLLADAVARGEVGLGDPLGRYLPAGARWRGSREVTLLHLATHTSGLPRLPRGFSRSATGSWCENPYGAYDEERLFALLPRTRSHARPGTRVAYSHLGVGLLGHVLARASGRPYRDLVVSRLGVPLGMTMTTCDPNAPQVTGYSPLGRPLPPWRVPALPAAGGLCSTGADLARYLAAHLDPEGVAPPSLARAAAEVRRPRLVSPHGGDRVCLVWNLRARAGLDLVFHGGGTRGFTSFVGFAPQAGVGFAASVNRPPGPCGGFVRAALGCLRDLAARSVSG